MKKLTQEALENFFHSQTLQYDVRVPVALVDGARSLGRIGEGEMQLLGGKLPAKPTNLFFPQICSEMKFECNKTCVSCAEKKSEKPLFVVGFTAEDANCLEFIDRFYDKNFHDDVYFGRRDNAVVVCVTGQCGADDTFLKLAEKNCDIECAYDGQQFLVQAYTDVGEKLLAEVGEEVSDTEWNVLKQTSDALSDEDQKLLEKASQLLLENKVPDEFWESIGQRCISCTACTLNCPTCTCFDIFDRATVNGEMKRWRVTDSCQLDGFMREASGHNPLGTEGERTRRRIYHKLAADVIRWGHMTCFLCGRCDDVCPSNIGIKSVCREMVEKYGE